MTPEIATAFPIVLSAVTLFLTIAIALSPWAKSRQWAYASGAMAAIVSTATAYCAGTLAHVLNGPLGPNTWQAMLLIAFAWLFVAMLGFFNAASHSQ